VLHVFKKLYQPLIYTDLRESKPFALNPCESKNRAGQSARPAEKVKESMGVFNREIREIREKAG